MIKSRPSGGGSRPTGNKEYSEIGKYIRPPEECCPHCRGAHTASECPNKKSKTNTSIEEGDINNKNEEKDKQDIEKVRERLKQTPQQNELGIGDYSSTPVYIDDCSASNDFSLSDLHHRMKLEEEMSKADMESEARMFEINYGTSKPSHPVSKPAELNPRSNKKTGNFSFFKWFKKLISSG